MRRESCTERISAQGLVKTKGPYSTSTVLSKLGKYKIYYMAG